MVKTDMQHQINDTNGKLHRRPHPLRPNVTEAAFWLLSGACFMGSLFFIQHFQGQQSTLVTGTGFKGEVTLLEQNATATDNGDVQLFVRLSNTEPDYGARVTLNVNCLNEKGESTTIRAFELSELPAGRTGALNQTLRGTQLPSGASCAVALRKYEFLVDADAYARGEADY